MNKPKENGKSKATKPTDSVKIAVCDHIVIRDKTSGKDVFKGRG